MEFTKELLEKAKTAKTAEELLTMAKAENIEMTAEEAAKAFAELHKTGELSDDELDNVAGGCSEEYKYDPGDYVMFYKPDGRTSSGIIRSRHCDCNGNWYTIQEDWIKNMGNFDKVIDRGAKGFYDIRENQIAGRCTLVGNRATLV